jgi:hypothetical protein
MPFQFVNSIPIPSIDRFLKLWKPVHLFGSLPETHDRPILVIRRPISIKGIDGQIFSFLSILEDGMLYFIDEETASLDNHLPDLWNSFFQLCKKSPSPSLGIKNIHAANSDWTGRDFQASRRRSNHFQGTFKGPPGTPGNLMTKLSIIEFR